MENYEFVKDIGSGNSGVAKLMKNKQSKELVAVKYIERGLKIDQKVGREITNQRSLCHPNIIQFREVVLTPTHLAIVMEYAGGGELFDRVNNEGRLSEDEARYFFQQLISGVSYCHSRQICHRDLKLENILLDWTDLSPLLKICDFGLSKSLLHSITQSTVGTPQYIAPEVLSAKEYDGKLADVWSCGVSLYVMMVGEYPFADKNDQSNIREIVKRIKAAQYVIPDLVYISEDCRLLLSRIFVTDPAGRITIQEIKNHPWFLKNLPREVIEADHTGKENPTISLQSVEDIMKIVEEAKNIPPSVSRSVGGSGDAKKTSMKRESKKHIKVGKEIEEGDLKKTSMKSESKNIKMGKEIEEGDLKKTSMKIDSKKHIKVRRYGVCRMSST